MSARTAQAGLGRKNGKLSDPEVRAAAILMLMERKEGKPGAANNRKKYLSAIFGWGVKALRDMVKFNPYDGWRETVPESVRQSTILSSTAKLV
jgi:hypothetical protein